MASTIGKRTLRALEKDGSDLQDALLDRISDLRSELADLSKAVNNYGGNTFDDIQHNALAIAKEVRHQGSVALREANKQAHVATKAVQENPIPALAVLGTIALLSALLFRRD
ncbi:MAG: hypothetical protein P0Y65_07440 [Candidatus Devosia phytovorans]|uniref:DUF883 domain-containing protein n=1 Tax=Candidatus Devosia phytovorans TaxID=3121372 RepID=A0AAJ5VYY1_9HYPH|nr:hypothetical protein [Devosia sp.]WEK06078.1 MAG: hypothetical protein P0Y65_07440 [Devosia sp.]